MRTAALLLLFALQVYGYRRNALWPYMKGSITLNGMNGLQTADRAVLREAIAQTTSVCGIAKDQTCGTSTVTIDSVSTIISSQVEAKFTFTPGVEQEDLASMLTLKQSVTQATVNANTTFSTGLAAKGGGFSNLTLAAGNASSFTIYTCRWLVTNQVSCTPHSEQKDRNKLWDRNTNFLIANALGLLVTACLCTCLCCCLVDSCGTWSGRKDGDCCAVFACCKELCGWCEPSLYQWSSYNTFIETPTNSVAILSSITVGLWVVIYLTGFTSVQWFDGVRSPGFEPAEFDTGTDVCMLLTVLGALGAASLLAVAAIRIKENLSRRSEQTSPMPVIDTSKPPTSPVQYAYTQSGGFIPKEGKLCLC